MSKLTDVLDMASGTSGTQSANVAGLDYINGLVVVADKYSALAKMTFSVTTNNPGGVANADTIQNVINVPATALSDAADYVYGMGCYEKSILDAIANLTDNSGGVSGGDTIGAVTNADLSAWNGSTDPTAAQATALGTMETALKAAVATLAAKVNALLTAEKSDWFAFYVPLGSVGLAGDAQMKVSCALGSALSGENVFVVGVQEGTVPGPEEHYSWFTRIGSSKVSGADVRYLGAYTASTAIAGQSAAAASVIIDGWEQPLRSTWAVAATLGELGSVPPPYHVLIRHNLGPGRLNAGGVVSLTAELNGTNVSAYTWLVCLDQTKEEVASKATIARAPGVAAKLMAQATGDRGAIARRQGRLPGGVITQHEEK